MSELNIVVCVKVVPKPSEVKLDPETKALDRRDADSIINPPDKNAIEAAVALKETYGGKVTLLSMAPPFFDDFMRLMMAMGADEAILVSDRVYAGADTYPTVMTLAKAIKRIGNVDLVLAGVESSDGGTGNVPPGLGEALNFSSATYAEEIDYDNTEDRFVVNRQNGSGYELISITKPAVISFELGANSPRFPNFARKKILDEEYKVKIWDNSILKIPEEEVGFAGSYTTVDDLVEVILADRKHEKISGTNEEIAEKLANLILSYS
jgi:electron transfer flavoprotein beta subunit